MLFVEPCALEAVHDIDEMREDDLHVRDLGHPVRIPFQRNEAVVIDGTQGIHQLFQGKEAASDQFRHRLVVNFPVIMDMHMPDISAQIGDGLFRVFLREIAGGVHIPERRQPVVGKTVQKVPQSLRVRVEFTGLYQDDDRLCPHPVKNVPDHIGTGAGIGRGSMDPDIGNSQIDRDPDALLHLPHKRRIRKVRNRIDTGNRESVADQAPPDGGGKFRIGRTLLARENRSCDIVQLDSAHPRADRSPQEFVPADSLPVLYGK